MRCTFDRGTLVLHDVPEEIVRSLDGIAWDERVGAHRAAASLWPAVHAAAVERGLDVARPGAEDDESTLVPVLPFDDAWCVPLLRPYQQLALDAWRAAGSRGVVVLPTGAGKTRVALAAMARAGQRSLVLVPTRALLAQWCEAIASARDGPIGRLGDGERSVARVTVATFASAWRDAAGLGDRFDLLVVDEAHHVGGALPREALQMSLATRRLGLTALPPAPRAGRSDDLDELVGPVVLQVTLRQLSGTSLAPLRLVGVGLDLTPEERAEWMADVVTWRTGRARHALDVHGRTFREAAAALRSSAEGRRALAALRRIRERLAYSRSKALALAAILERHRGERTLVFTADNRSAHAIAREHLIAPITCETRGPERRRILGAFASGELRALVSARVLNEGVDLPEASVGVVVGASRSAREHVQRVGRLLRPATGKRAVLYDLFTLETGEARNASARRRALAP